MGVAPFRSTSIFPTLTLPLYSVASSSTMGAIARHGPHHAAQKSTSTGLSDFSTSESKFASVTSTIALLAIVPPDIFTCGSLSWMGKNRTPVPPGSLSYHPSLDAPQGQKSQQGRAPDLARVPIVE